MTTRKSQIRKDNVGRILLAAEKIFALKGYVGASMVDIAAEVELPKSNLHYYFSTKEALYRAVLDGLLALWKEDALCFEAYDDPQLVLSTNYDGPVGDEYCSEEEALRRHWSHHQRARRVQLHLQRSCLNWQHLRRRR